MGLPRAVLCQGWGCPGLHLPRASFCQSWGCQGCSCQGLLFARVGVARAGAAQGFCQGLLSARAGAAQRCSCQELLSARAAPQVAAARAKPTFKLAISQPPLCKPRFLSAAEARPSKASIAAFQASCTIPPHTKGRFGRGYQFETPAAIKLNKPEQPAATDPHKKAGWEGS